MPKDRAPLHTTIDVPKGINMSLTNRNMLNKDSIWTVDNAFVEIIASTHQLLDAVEAYMVSNPPDTLSLQMKHEQLQPAIQTLGKIPSQLAGVITAWKKGTSNALSAKGIEVELLNEVQITVYSLLQFFEREKIRPAKFSQVKFMEAWKLLLVLNRQL